MGNIEPQKNEVPQRERKLWMYAWIQYPLVWMVVGALILILADGLLSRFIQNATGFESIMLAITKSIAAIALYVLTMKWLAHRRVPELSIKNAVNRVSLGALIGFIFIVISTLLIVILGGYSFKWLPGSAGDVIWPTISTALGAAVVEELIFRGIAFQAIEKMIGSRFALMITSLFFGIAHLGNPGATIWSAAAIAIEAGVLLGAAFLWRRSLWLVIGIHFVWNAVVGLLGIPVSGHPSSGLFSVQVTGSSLLTGGSFGIEASVVTVIISLLLSVPMLMLAKKGERSTK